LITPSLGVSKQKILELFQKLLSSYTYIYIPIENKISDILNLQANEMQGLMDRSVTAEIIKLLSDKNYSDVETEKRSSIVDLINSNLDNYIEEINSRISDGYKFEPRGTNKKTVKPNDILQSILKEYFSIRPLTKDGKHVKSLSSGQQRLALMDVASTLLSGNDEKNRKIILGIDEPESSLESSNRFEQFSRLVDIAESHGHQILLTTHWYGLLLRPSTGRLNFVSEGEISPKVKGYSLKNLYESRRDFPDSIEMKSYFDLMSSMLSLLKKGRFNWLICEGYEDSLYLGAYLKKRIGCTYILPFNGCGNLKKLYQFLAVPFSDKNEQPYIIGRVVFLIDTDEKSVITIPGYKSANFKDKLRFHRLSLDREKDESKLISVADTNATNTEIEDVLEPKIMWETLVFLSEEDSILKHYLESFSFQDTVEHTDLTKEASFLKKENVEAYEKFSEFKDYISSDNMKQKIARKYCSLVDLYDRGFIPDWMIPLEEYFNRV
jgi:energy-coupling factor transporter ATP-binding protein EcfA2